MAMSYRHVVRAAGVVLLAAALAACGSSTSSSTTSSGASTTSPSSAGTSAAVAAAKAEVSSLLVRPTSLSVPPLPSRPPTGLTIDYMACGVPVCDAMGNFVAQAAAVLGWHFVEIQEGGTPQTITAAYDQAVRNDPAGVVGSGGYPPSLMAHQLAELKAEHVPTVLVDVPALGNATAVILSSATQAEYGQELGAWILANSGGKDAHVAIMTSPLTPIYAAAHAALEKELASGCAHCSVQTYSFPFTSIGTTLPTKVVTYLLAHPSVNYLFFDFSNEVDGVPAALASAGLSGKVKIVTTDTTATESEYLIHGQEAAAAGIPWPEMLWDAVNVIVRAHMGLPIAPAVDMSFPRMILTGQNLPSAALSGMFPLVANFRSFYEAAWHVGS